MTRALSTAQPPAPSGTPPRSAPARRFGPRGMPWLVWRQHRVAFLLLSAGAAAMTAYLLWRAGSVHDAMRALEAGTATPRQNALIDEAYRDLGGLGSTLSFLPLLIGVFIGAPLFAGDLESGTAKLVGAQSHSRASWVISKLGMAAVFTAAAAVSTGLALRGMWSPLADHWAANADFTSTEGFDTTGPTAVVMGLLGLLLGATAGLLAKRTLPAMVITLFGVLAVQQTWASVRMEFADTVVKTTSGGAFTPDDLPEVPSSALEIDHSYLTADGSLLGWSTCSDATDADACLGERGVVGWAVEIFPHSHLTGMQWTAAAALCAVLALTAAVTVFAARRALR
ncbi:ABC transporter permease [Streptomyces xiamenensis]